MNWMISAAAAVLLTTLTATILFLIWYTIGKILEITGFINVLYMMLKVILVFWYVPIAFLAMIGISHIKWGGLLFEETKELKIGSLIFCIAWGGGVVFLIGKYLLEALGMGRKYKNAVPIDDEIYDYFEDVCKKLKIPEGKVDLVNDYAAVVPYIGGLFRNYVVLPNAEYTPEQLRVIFFHELTHYKQRNHIMRHFTEIAFAFHFFNPFMWLFRSKVAYWGEYACDFEVIPTTGGYETYFETIREISKTPTFVQKLVSGLFGTKDELEKRKKLMKRSYRYMMKSKLLAIVVAVGMIFASTVTVEAAMEVVGDSYVTAFMQTADLSTESMSDEVIEYMEEGFDSGVRVTYDGPRTTMFLGIESFSWTVRKGAARVTSAFNAVSGQTISVSATASPMSVPYRLGIVDPDGYLRYISVTNGSGAYSFALTKTGSYCVYAQNVGDASITVAGNYLVE